MITPEQRERRRKVIGSSDSPVICGVDQYKNIRDLWLDKTGQLAERQDADCDRGNDLEIAVLNMFERKMNVMLARDLEIHADGSIFGANLDGAITSAIIDLHPIKAIVEAKTTRNFDEWGEDIDDVPLKVLVQAHHQMMVADCTVAYVAVLFDRRFDFRIYQLTRVNDLIEQIQERGYQFWNRYVKPVIPPPDVMPHLDYLKRIKREPNAVIKLGESELAEWGAYQYLGERIKKLNEERERLYQSLVVALGNAEAGEFDNGERLTYLEQNGARKCDFDRLQMRLREIGHEEIYNELVSAPRFRVLRHRKAPKK